MKELHVSVNEDVLFRVDSLCRRFRLTRNALVRQALEDFVTRRERESVSTEMAQYAGEMASYSADFVAQTGGEVDRQLAEHTEW